MEILLITDVVYTAYVINEAKTLALIRKINRVLEEYCLNPRHLEGYLDSFHQNVVQVDFNLHVVEGPVATVIHEYGLLEPTVPQKVPQKYLPPLPKEIFPLLEEFRQIPSFEAKNALHKRTLITIPRQGGRLYCASTPSDFMDPTYAPSNQRARITLNTIDFNRMILNSIQSRADFEIYEKYPKFEPSELPKNAALKCDFQQDLIELPREKDSEIFDFKGYQTDVFTYALACYHTNVLEKRLCDSDELFELTQSRITLAELRERYPNSYTEEKLARSKAYLRKRRKVVNMVRRHVTKLIRLGFLLPYRERFLKVAALSFTDKCGRTLWFPPETLLRKIHIDNLKVWRPLKEHLNNLPGQPERRVFLGGSSPFLPTLRVVQGIVKSNGMQPILAFDFDIPHDDTYAICIHLLYGCGSAIFEVSEFAGQIPEVQKALEFGTPCLLIMKESEGNASPLPQGFSMLETMAKRHRAKIEKYASFEDLQSKIEAFLRSISPHPLEEQTSSLTQSN